jgi:hypothetical protein
MASTCGNDTRVWYANSTRTSIGCYDGTGLKIISPHMSVEQGDQEWYYKAFPPGKQINSPASSLYWTRTGKMFKGSDHSIKLGGEASTLREYLNKPLPALPGQHPPRSDLISATVGVNSYTGRTASNGESSLIPVLP